MKRFLLSKLLMASIICSVFFMSTVAFVQGQTNGCISIEERGTPPPVLGAPPAGWYPYRTVASGFTSGPNGNPGMGLLVHINGAVHQASYTTSDQGYQHDVCNHNVTIFQGDLFIPLDWKTKHRRTLIGAFGYSLTSTSPVVYPQIGFRNIDGQSPGIYYWNGKNSYNSTGVNIKYNTWYTLTIKIVNRKIEYWINGKRVGSIDTNDAIAYLGQVEIEAYNFNADGLDAKYMSTDSYDAMWDNLVTKVGSVQSAAAQDQVVTMINGSAASQISSKIIASNFPNPFTRTTRIQYQLPVAGKVSIKVFDILGRPVSNLVNEDKVAGSYSVDFDGSKLSKGNYYYRIILNGENNQSLTHTGNMNISK